MHLVIAYDIADDRSRQKLHAFLKEIGIGVQRSVFECEVGEALLTRIVAFARPLIDPKEDSLRIYRLCRRCSPRVRVSGQGENLFTTDWLLL